MSGKAVDKPLEG